MLDTINLKDYSAVLKMDIGPFILFNSPIERFHVPWVSERYWT